MNKDEWKDLFEQDRTVFLCETEDLANKLLIIAHDLGYQWCSSISYLEHNNWDYIKENTCYNIKLGYITGKYNNTVINVKELFIDRKPFKLHR